MTYPLDLFSIFLSVSDTYRREDQISLIQHTFLVRATRVGQLDIFPGGRVYLDPSGRVLFHPDGRVEVVGEDGRRVRRPAHQVFDDLYQNSRGNEDRGEYSSFALACSKCSVICVGI
jgi:hypothetical protein